jgi:hypothetical protein
MGVGSMSEALLYVELKSKLLHLLSMSLYASRVYLFINYSLLYDAHGHTAAVTAIY